MFFLIAIGLFMLIVLYSVFKKKQKEWHSQEDTSSYIDPGEIADEYLDVKDDIHDAIIKPTVRPSASSPVEPKKHLKADVRTEKESHKSPGKLNVKAASFNKIAKSKIGQVVQKVETEITTDHPAKAEQQISGLETRAAKTIGDNVEISPVFDVDTSTIVTSLVAKIKNPLPIEQQELLTLFRLHDFKFNRSINIYGLNQLTEKWRDIEFDLPSARFVELGVSIQLADRDGAMSEKELHDFQQMVLEFTTKFDAPFEFSMPIDDAFEQGQALDVIGRRYDSMAVLNIVSKTQNGFRAADLGSCARDLLMSSDKKGIYLKTIGQKDNISVLYRLANTDGAGNLVSIESNKAVSHDLVMYMNVPATKDPQKVFEEMVKDANSLAAWLEGKVVDRNRHAMTDHSYAVLMQQITDISTNMKKDGLSPGDAVSKILF